MEVASASREAFADQAGGADGKGGDRRPPFFVRVKSAYRFLPPFFFPPLAFFAIQRIPPFIRSLRSRELPPLHGPAAASWHASAHVSALSASLLTLARDARDLQPKKLGVPLDVNTPRNRLTARSTASCRPSSFRP